MSQNMEDKPYGAAHQGFNIQQTPGNGINLLTEGK